MSEIIVAIKCSCGNVLGSATFNNISQDDANTRVAGVAQCSICAYVGGVPVTLSNAEKTILASLQPEISSINLSSGPAAGGISVNITGQKLDKGNLVVQFGNVPGLNVRNRTATSATVDVPPGQFTLNLRGLTVGVLNPGDQVTGSITSSSGTIVSTSPTTIIVTNVTGIFDNSEWISKDANNKVQLAASAAFLNRAVDVIVKNDKGRCCKNSSMPGVFTYTVP